jgi:hypothetical protein
MEKLIADLDLLPGLKDIEKNIPEDAVLQVNGYHGGVIGIGGVSLKGEHNPMYGKEGPNKGKFGEDHPRYGKSQTEKQKEAVRKSRKGKVASEETRQKLRDAWKKRKETFVSPFIEMHKNRKNKCS